MTSCKMGEGLGGWNFCDTRYKGVGKINVLVWQWGEGVNKSPNLCDVIFE